MSKTDVIHFYIANVKVEVLGSNDMIYGCTVDGKVTASAATGRKGWVQCRRSLLTH